jgi:colanic acid/amylovoran biosynthesis glycosyltransferase
VRIALVTSRFPFHPAAESFLHEEILELTRRFDVTIVPSILDAHASFDDSLAPMTAPLKLFEPSVLSGTVREFARSPLRTFSAFLTVVSKPRSLQAKLRNAAIFPKAVAVARLLRARRVEHVHAYWLSAPATIAYVVSQLIGVPWSATGHRYDLVDYNLTAVGMPRAGFIAAARFVRVISQNGARYVKAALGARNAERVKVVHLGVRLPEHTAPATHRNSFRLICAGGLVPVKDHPTLLRAIASARQRGVRVECTIAGEGPQRGSLQSLARELVLGDVVSFEGALRHEELLQRIRSGTYEAAILTSTDQGLQHCEGIPVFLMEAMAAGLPCIATASGSIPELVDKRNGMLCSPGDIEALSAAIVALSTDPTLRARLGEGARTTIEAAFNVTAMSQQLAALIDQHSEDDLVKTNLQEALHS